MIKLENYEVVGWEHAIRGMRNPMNSWDRMDSFVPCYWKTKCHECEDNQNCGFYFEEGKGEAKNYNPYNNFIGPNDHDLMMRLAKGGPVHAKYRRMITVYVDITAPLYWWKEMDTYKVGTVANSCSTMHKIHAKEFTLDDFSHEHLLDNYFGDEAEANIDIGDADWTPCAVLELIVAALNHYRNKYLEYKTKPMKDESKRAGLRKKYWQQMIQLLPTSYNQKRTVMLNYEVLHNIYESRRNHKLEEWHVFCDWIEKLPYSEVIIGEE